MSAVLCYGDSNTWGYAASSQQRLGRWERWPGVVQRALGEDVHVIEEALQGAVQAVDVWLRKGIAECMNRYNG